MNHSGFWKFFIALPIAVLHLGGCSVAFVKFECRELEERLKYEDMSEDQQRFARMELEDCRNRVLNAQVKDSTLQERGIEGMFREKNQNSNAVASPSDSLSKADSSSTHQNKF